METINFEFEVIEEKVFKLLIHNFFITNSGNRIGLSPSYMDSPSTLHSELYDFFYHLIIGSFEK